MKGRALLASVRNALARGCIHTDASGRVLRTPLEILRVLKADGEVMVLEPKTPRVRHFKPAVTPHEISSARIEFLGAHEHVSIWVGGARSGELVVDPGVGELLLKRLGLEEAADT